MRRTKSKTLRRFAALIATDQNEYWQHRDGSQRLMPKCSRAVYQKLKRQKLASAAYARIQARIPQLEAKRAERIAIAKAEQSEVGV